MRAGHSVDLVGPFTEETIAWNAGRGFRMCQLPVHAALRGRAANLSLWKHALAGLPRYDVLIGITPVSYTAAHLAWRTGKAGMLVYYALELARPQEEARSISVRYQARYARDADLVMATGDERADIMRTEFRLPTRPLVVHNSCLNPASAGRTSLRGMLPAGVSPESKLVLFQGNLSAQNCTEELIASAAHWRRDAVLVLIGYGSENAVAAVRNRIREMGLQDRVFYLGAVEGTREDLLAITAGADLGLAFKAHDAKQIMNDVLYTPTKLYDYMAAGVPVVCSDNPSLRFVQDQGWGVCAKSIEPRAIAATINEVLDDEGRRIEMSQTAQRLFAGTYNYGRQAEPVLRAIGTHFGSA